MWLGVVDPLLSLLLFEINSCVSSRVRGRLVVMEEDLVHVGAVDARKMLFE